MLECSGSTSLPPGGLERRQGIMDDGRPPGAPLFVLALPQGWGLCLPHNKKQQGFDALPVCCCVNCKQYTHAHTHTHTHTHTHLLAAAATPPSCFFSVSLLISGKSLHALTPYLAFSLPPSWCPWAGHLLLELPTVLVLVSRLQVWMCFKGDFPPSTCSLASGHSWGYKGLIFTWHASNPTTLLWLQSGNMFKFCVQKINFCRTFNEHTVAFKSNIISS